MLYFSSYTIYSTFTLQTPSNSNNNKSLLLFDGLWKVKAKYIVLFLNAWANFQNASVAFPHSALMSNFPTCNHVYLPHQSNEYFDISLFHVMCEIWDSVATIGLLLEKNFDEKCMQVNVLKNVTKIKERVGGIQTD